MEEDDLKGIDTAVWTWANDIDDSTGLINSYTNSITSNAVSTVTLAASSLSTGSVFAFSNSDTSVDFLGSKDAEPGSVLVVGKDGKPEWSNSVPSFEVIKSNPALLAAFEKLMQAYQEFKMVEQLSKES